MHCSHILPAPLKGMLFDGRRFLLPLLLLFASLMPHAASAAWQPGFEYPTLTDISAMARDSQGQIYIGGAFSYYDGTELYSIARWDGTTLYPLGSGIKNTYGAVVGAVRALAFDSAGNLYAGGDFTTAGGVSASNIAKWDGASWSALGEGVGGSVSALAFDGAGNLYAGGSFTTAGGVSANNIARWDGASWSALGGGMDAGVSALVFDSAGNLYVGGGFTTAGGVSANRVAKWNGASWSTLGEGMGPYVGLFNYPSSVSALAFDSAGNLYAGGDFTTAGGVSASNIAKWDGASWSALGGGMNGTVDALAFDSAGNLYAGGSFTTAGGVGANRIAKWNGASWSALHTGIDGEVVRSLLLDNQGNLYAGGENIVGAGGVSINRDIAHWDGAAWHNLGGDVQGNGFYRVANTGHVDTLAFDSAGTLYAGGDFSNAGKRADIGSIAYWDGGQWAPLGEGVYGSVSALAFDNGGGLYVGGRFYSAGGLTANSIAKWNGSAWSVLGSGVTQAMAFGYYPEGWINDLALDRHGNLYAGGYFVYAGGVTVNNIAKWDGANWIALGEGMNGTVDALAFDSAGNLYAGGSFTTAGGVSVNGIARWDGTSWSALGEGMNIIYAAYFSVSAANVSALAFDSAGNLYAGGSFTTAGGISANRIARWDGTSWSAVGEGVDGWSVFDLAFDSAGNLYAGGSFTTAGGVSANGIARWDGTSWSALGEGMNTYGGVSALAFDSVGNLYAGGGFFSAGGISSNHIALWTPDALPVNYAFATATATAGTGSGTLSGSTADGSYLEGTTIALVATPDAGSVFAGWSPATCVDGFSLNADTTCTATFNPNPLVTSVILTVTASGTGSGAVSGGGTFDYNTSVTPTAAAGAGSVFTGWTPASCGTPFNLTADTVCTANFNLSTRTLTVNAGGTGSGTVGGGGTFNYGSLVTPTAVPDADSTFIGWTPAGCGNSFNLLANTTCTAEFSTFPLVDLATSNYCQLNPDYSACKVVDYCQQNSSDAMCTGVHFINNPSIPGPAVTNNIDTSKPSPSPVISIIGLNMLFNLYGQSLSGATLTVEDCPNMQVLSGSTSNPRQFYCVQQGLPGIKKAIVRGSNGAQLYSFEVDARFDCRAVTEIPTEECGALVSLYESTSGENWTNAASNKWLRDIKPCAWVGITCAGGHITDLNLANNNLSGTVSGLCDALPQLQNLDLSGNSVSGETFCGVAVIKPIDDMLLTEGDSPVSLDLSLYFQAHSTLNFTVVSNTNTTAVSSSAANAQLTIAPLSEGIASITVKASTAKGASESLTFKVTVAAQADPNQPGSTITTTLSSNVEIDSGKSGSIDLNTFFQSTDNLTYTVTSTNPSVFAVELDGSTLRMTAGKAGTADITITAKTASGEMLSKTVSVTVLAAGDGTGGTGSGSTTLQACPPILGGNITISCAGTNNQLVLGSTADGATLSNVQIAAIFQNHGTISDSTIAWLGHLRGGTLSGVITNGGMISDVTFTGTELSGGVLRGQITNTNPDGIIRDVQLGDTLGQAIYDVMTEVPLTATVVSGGILAGNIIGDCGNPPKLEHVRVADDTLLKCVTLGEGVELGVHVKLEIGQPIPPELTIIDSPSTDISEGEYIKLAKQLYVDSATCTEDPATNTARCKFNVYNASYGDAALVVKDANGELYNGSFILIEGNRPKTSVIEGFTDEAMKTWSSFTDDYSIFDVRTDGNSKKTEVDIVVPIGGTISISRGDEYGLVANAFTMALEAIGMALEDKIDAKMEGKTLYTFMSKLAEKGFLESLKNMAARGNFDWNWFKNNIPAISSLLFDAVNELNGLYGIKLAEAVGSEKIKDLVSSFIAISPQIAAVTESAEAIATLLNLSGQWMSVANSAQYVYEHGRPEVVIPVESISKIPPGFNSAQSGYLFSTIESGNTGNMSLRAALNPFSVDNGKEANIYLAAQVGSFWYFHNGVTWLLYEGGTLPVYIRTVLYSGLPFSILENADISAYSGIRFYMGYGSDEADMLQHARYQLIYQVP